MYQIQRICFWDQKNRSVSSDHFSCHSPRTERRLINPEISRRRTATFLNCTKAIAGWVILKPLEMPTAGKLPQMQSTN